ADIRADAWATMLYVPNWRAVLAERDYWALFRTPSPLQHTWSLGIEEQFYLVWPLALAGVLAAFPKRTPWVVWAGSLLLAAASAAWMWISYDPKDPSRVYYGTDTRAAAILLGAALAASHAIWGPPRSRWARILVEIAGAAGMAVLAVAWWRLSGDSPALYRGGFAVCGLAGVALIAAAVQPQRGPLAWMLARAPVRLLGIISYGVYLWHWPVYLVLDSARTGLPDWALVAVRVAATILVALASYVLLERPILAGALAWRRWAVIAPAVAVALVLAILVGTAGSRPGASLAPDARLALHGTAPHKPGSVRVLILGDSLAVSLYSGLEHAAADHDLEVSVGVKVGCELDNAAPECPPPWAAQVAEQRPDVVLVAETGYWSLIPRVVGAEVLAIGTARWDEEWTRERQAIVDELRAAGARRFVFTTLPCFRRLWLRRFPPENTARANADLSALAARNAPHVQLVDLARYLCPKGRYQPGLGAVETMRFDGLHLTDEGSDLVGRWLAPQLARAAQPDSPP
ncbi:MAG: acyltransferase family protein, partial [Candidatus Binatia bacterium]